jgi:hypothetical protein
MAWADVLYILLGFFPTYLALETAWHFTACKHRELSSSPCVFKQVKMVAVRSKYPARGVRRRQP